MQILYRHGQTGQPAPEILLRQWISDACYERLRNLWTQLGAAFMDWYVIHRAGFTGQTPNQSWMNLLRTVSQPDPDPQTHGSVPVRSIQLSFAAPVQPPDAAQGFGLGIPQPQAPPAPVRPVHGASNTDAWQPCLPPPPAPRMSHAELPELEPTSEASGDKEHGEGDGADDTADGAVADADDQAGNDVDADADPKEVAVDVSEYVEEEDELDEEVEEDEEL